MGELFVLVSRPALAETKIRFCRICEALCGLEIDLQDGRAVDIRPDAEHPATAGFACIKGLQQHHMYSSPDRLLRPLARSAGELAAVVERCRDVRLSFCDPRVADPFRIPPDAAYNPVMCFHNGICDSSAPFHDADG